MKLIILVLTVYYYFFEERILDSILTTLKNKYKRKNLLLNKNFIEYDLNYKNPHIQNLLHAHNVINEQQEIMNKQNNYNQIFMENQQKILEEKDEENKKLEIENDELKDDLDSQDILINKLKHINYIMKQKILKLKGINKLYEQLIKDKKNNLNNKLHNLNSEINTHSNNINSMLNELHHNLNY